MPYFARHWHGFLAALCVVIAGQALAVEPEPCVFDGFGLEDFSGTGSIAAELRRLEAEERQAGTDAVVPVDVAVRGPSGRDVDSPLTAELRSRFEAFDVAAGLRADRTLAVDGPSQWSGRIKLADERETGSEAIELRTTVGPRRRDQDGRVLGVELGPRIERRLRRGITFFIDGKAEARAAWAAEAGNASTGGTADRDAMVGVSARTGIIR